MENKDTSPKLVPWCLRYLSLRLPWSLWYLSLRLPWRLQELSPLAQAQQSVGCRHPADEARAQRAASARVGARRPHRQPRSGGAFPGGSKWAQPRRASRPDE
jgi:hypothetical protein